MSVRVRDGRPVRPGTVPATPPAAPARPEPGPTMDGGILLLQGRREHVIAWVRRGTLPVYVVPGTGEHVGWFGVIAAGASQAGAPYDEGVPMLAGHPVPSRLRPAIGMFTAGERVLVCVAPRGWRQATRWVAWAPGEARHPLPGLPLARPEHLAAAAGFDRPTAVDTVAAVLADPGGHAGELVEDLMLTLRLPFAESCRGTPGAALPGAELVGPAPVAVERFVRTVSEEKRLEHELEEGL